jgi:hypothetical protein
MPEDHFRSQANLFEQTFYADTNHSIVIELQQQFTLDTLEETIAAATGIVAREVVQELLALEITPMTLMAFSLFPAIHVAWADGHIEAAEQADILKSAERLGIIESSPTFSLLESWLSTEPSDELFAAWKSFIHSARPVLSDVAFFELRDAAIKRAQHVARAAGEVLAFHNVSKKEQAAIGELAAVFAEAVPPASR